jgi:peroxiredoxin
MSRETTRSGPLIALAIFVIGLAVASGTVLVPRLMGMPVADAPGQTGLPPGLTPVTDRRDAPAGALRVPFMTESGAHVTLEEFRGRIVVLNFWATWCPPCVREMPALDRLHALLQGDRFAVVAVSTDRGEIGALRRFYDRTSVTHLPVYHDPSGTLARTFGVEGLPTTYILDHTGKILAEHTGYMDWDHDRFVNWFVRRIREIQG